MKDSDYIIIGDTERFDGCLVCIAGKTKQSADETLNRMLNNPTESDKRLIERHKNLRIEEIPEEKCWWRDV